MSRYPKLDRLRALREDVHAPSAQRPTQAMPTKLKRTARPTAQTPITPAVSPSNHIAPPDLAERLRHLRTSRGESLQQAAAEIGCTKPHLWELESGKSDNPSLRLLRGLAKHYGVTVAQIIGEAP